MHASDGDSSHIPNAFSNNPASQGMEPFRHHHAPSPSVASNGEYGRSGAASVADTVHSQSQDHSGFRTSDQGMINRTSYSQPSLMGNSLPTMYSPTPQSFHALGGGQQAQQTPFHALGGGQQAQQTQTPYLRQDSSADVVFGNTFLQLQQPFGPHVPMTPVSSGFLTSGGVGESRMYTPSQGGGPSVTGSTTTTAVSEAATKQRSVRIRKRPNGEDQIVPLDKVTIRMILKDPLMRQLLQEAVQDGVEAAMAASHDQYATVLDRKVASVLSEYSTVINAFNSRIITAEGDVDTSMDAHQSSDGYQYLRIKEVGLERFFHQLGSLRRMCESEIQSVRNEIASSEKKVLAALESVSVGGPSSSGSSSKSSKSKQKQKQASKDDWEWLAAKTGFKSIVAEQAGLSPDKNGEVKIYHVPYPTEPSQHKYHPVTFQPIGVEVGGGEADTAAGVLPRYRMLRVDFNASITEVPNKNVINRIAVYMAKHFAEFGMREGVTVADVKEQVIKPVWKHWKRKFDEINALTDEQLQRKHDEDKRRMRANARLSTKARYRFSMAQKAGNLETGVNQQDRFIAAIFHPDYQSAEETDEEVDLVTGISSKILKRLIPLFRSVECKRLLHRYDRHRRTTYKIVDSGKTYDLPPHADLQSGVRKWALARGWVANNPDRLPSLVRPNMGPFDGDHAVAYGPDEYGTDPVASNRLIAPTTTTSADDGLAIVRSDVGHSGRRPGMASAFGISSPSAEASGSNTVSSGRQAGMATATSFGMAGPSRGAGGALAGAGDNASGGFRESDDEDDEYSEEE
ncbi:hypothetical protein CF326_g7634 [Tilletia indica]|nr:hypothetical protein CF326_g7634 [Tilletia indica]